MKVFIPIKENSQRVPRKNFRLIGETPLYKYVLNNLKNLDVFVDTDSDEIIREIKEDKLLKNITVFKRAQSLIGDKVSVCDLIHNFIEKYNLKEEYICQVHVTSPFINEALLRKAFEKTSCEYDSVVSCNEIQSRFWRKEKYGYAPINHNPMKLEQTQDLPVYYEENSAFYIFQSDSFRKTKNRIGACPYFYPIKFPLNLDIDTEDDWELVSRILN